MKTTIYIPDDQMAALDAMAKREARPKAQLIREAIELYVVDNAQPMPEAVGIFDDVDVDSSNVDEWLRDNWRPE